MSALHIDSAANVDDILDDDDQLLEGFLQKRETPGVKIVNRPYADQLTIRVNSHWKILEVSINFYSRPFSI